MNSKAKVAPVVKKATVVQLPVKRAPRLKRVVKRGIRIREASETHIRYFYAGYKLGAFKEQIDGTDMTAIEFTDALTQYTEPFTHLFTSDTGEEKPLCLGVGKLEENRLEIHNIWMPWATPRNKLESTIAFYTEYNRWYTVITTIFEEALPFYNHVRKYGVVRLVGEIRDFNEKGTVYIFQGVKK